MIRWIYQNVNHLTVPFGMLLAMMAAIIGFIVRRKQKAGLQPPYTSRGVRVTATVVVLAGFVFLGILLVHNFS